MVSPPNGKTLTLEEYKSPWFETIDDARTFLIESATSLIDATLDATREKEHKSFPSLTAQESEAVSPESQPTDAQSVYVELENGQKAKVNLPGGM